VADDQEVRAGKQSSKSTNQQIGRLWLDRFADFVSYVGCGGIRRYVLGEMTTRRASPSPKLWVVT
jgi:hypothetical protein